MNKHLKIKTITAPLVIITLLLLTGSCTVYRYDTATAEDGIYSKRNPEATRNYSGNYDSSQNYYKQYFRTKQGTYAEILESEEESALFTDIEAYSSRDYIADDGHIYTQEVYANEEQYPGWGNNATSVNINFYGNGYYNPWNYNSFYGYWGYPYYRYGFYSPGWYGGFGWHGGIGLWYRWGGGFYNPYYYYPSYYYPHYSYRPYYNNVSYNRGRRNTDYYSPRTSTSGRTNSNSIHRGRTSSDIGARSNNINTSRRNATLNTNSRSNSTIDNSTRRNSTLYRGNSTTSSRRVIIPQQQRSNLNRSGNQNTTTPSRRPATNQHQQRNNNNSTNIPFFSFKKYST